MADLKVIRMHRFSGDSKLKAFADIAIGDFIIKGFRVCEGKNGLFLGLPQEKGKDGKWYNTVQPASDEVQQSLSEVVLAAYQE